MHYTTHTLYTICTGGSEWRVSDGGPGGHHRRLALRHTGLHRCVVYIYIYIYIYVIYFIRYASHIPVLCIVYCMLYAYTNSLSYYDIIRIHTHVQVWSPLSLTLLTGSREKVSEGHPV